MIHYSKLKALIVEDFTEFARAVSTMLRDMGISHTDTVTSAEAAIQACREHKYDIILSDYNLGPQKDGQQLLEELIEFNLIKPKTTFVMVTAEKNAAMVMAAIEFLPDAYVTKPFNRHLLKSKLDKAIAKKQTLEPIKIAMRKCQWMKAIELCANVANQNPKYKNTCNQLKMKCLIANEQLDEAGQFIKQLQKKRCAPWVLRSQGIILYKQQELDQSIECFNRLIHDYPMYLEGYDWLAKIQHQLNRPIEAQKTLQKAVLRSPKLIKRQKLLGGLAEQNNDINSMTEAYRQAVKYGEHSVFRSAEEYVKLTKSIGLQLKGDAGRQRKTNRRG
ncbi:MAG: response regulator [Enterobacterales bacterium]|nr:response regulator [Enterobacterales bacterium]